MLQRYNTPVAFRTTLLLPYILLGVILTTECCCCPASVANCRIQLRAVRYPLAHCNSAATSPWFWFEEDILSVPKTRRDRPVHTAEAVLHRNARVRAIRVRIRGIRYCCTATAVHNSVS